MGALDEIIDRVRSLPPGEQEIVTREALSATEHLRWVPNPGPQTEAFFSEADELLYGGEPGGGKTDLGIGLSMTAHQRSLVLRRTNKEAEKLPDRYEEIIGHRDGYNSTRSTWRLGGGRIVDMGGCQNEDDKQKRKGIPHDLKFFDELPDFTRTQYEFIIAWNRSTDPNQRCRIVATANPPTNPQGVWVIERWGPWLNPAHPHPAKPGELRWYKKNEDGDEVECDGPEWYVHDGKRVRARSRTFIRSRLEDNPDLAATDYGSNLAFAGKEMQGLAKGDFESALEDTPNQAIPTFWVRLAQKRWTSKAPQGIPQCAIGVDCSGGGKDPLVLAPRHDGWFAPFVVVPGKEIPAERIGAYSAGIVVSHRRDNALVIVDMGGGYGGPIYEKLHENSIECEAYKGAEKTNRRTRDRKLGFVNKRSAAIWGFREALDPDQPGGSPIALPADDQELLADLCAPTFTVTPHGYQVESKEDVTDRLGRSTNKGDAVVMSWFAGPKAATATLEWLSMAEMRRPLNRRPQVIMGRHNAARR